MQSTKCACCVFRTEATHSEAGRILPWKPWIYHIFDFEFRFGRGASGSFFCCSGFHHHKMGMSLTVKEAKFWAPPKTGRRDLPRDAGAPLKTGGSGGGGNIARGMAVRF